jgi:hypothetical protein
MVGLRPAILLLVHCHHYTHDTDCISFSSFVVILVYRRICLFTQRCFDVRHAGSGLAFCVHHISLISITGATSLQSINDCQ